jgi:ribulose 1,5-bisphosphate carboxylase large subunit-like protein
MSVDYERELLKVLENGGNLKYNLIYGDVDQLVGTEYDDMVSYSYKRWKERVVEHYKALQDVSAQFAGKDIIGHTTIAEDVTETVYENGKVIVNYRDDAYTTAEGVEIPAKQYKVVLGGAK